MDRGVWEIGGSASFDHSRPDGDGSNPTTILQASPRVGYFVAPGLAVTGNVSFLRISNQVSSATSYGLGPGLAYYFKRRPAAVHPFLAMSVRYVHERGSSQGTPAQTSHSFAWDSSAGLAASIARNVAITSEIYYTRYRYTLGPQSGENGIRSYGVRFGVAVFLY